MATPIAAGTPNWDVPANSNFTTLQSQATALLNNSNWGATDSAAIAWTMDGACVGTGSTQLVNGGMFLSRIIVRSGTTINAINAAVSVAGTSLTLNQNWAGLYNSSGTLIGSSNNQSATWTSTGLKTMSLVTPVVVSAGSYYFGLITNGSGTIPSFRSTGSTSTGMLNFGAPSPGRFISFGASLTTLPASFTLGSAAQTAFGIWGAFS